QGSAGLIYRQQLEVLPWHVTQALKIKSAGALVFHSSEQPRHSSKRITRPECTAPKAADARRVSTQSPWARSKSSVISTECSRSSFAATLQSRSAPVALRAKCSCSSLKPGWITSFFGLASQTAGRQPGNLSD